VQTPEKRRELVRNCLKKRKSYLKKAKLCQDCGNRPPFEDKTLCFECLLARREREAKKRKEKKERENERIERMVQIAGNQGVSSS
jgi:hypothetical protein